MRKLIVIGFALISLLSANGFEKRGSLIYDSKTELSWVEKPSSTKMKWQEAKDYCENLELRLPNLYELKSLVDYGKYNKAIRTELIDVEVDNWYWTSSQYKGKSDEPSAWVVLFTNGNDYRSNKANTNYVLCVSGQ